MEQSALLKGEALEQAVKGLNVGWAVLPGKGLVRVVPTTGFQEGFAIVSRIARLAEQQQHDPELTLRRDEVEIVLNTLEAGGITSRDSDMAKAVDALLE
ncbi:hypothetical protein CYG49_00135 [Candidatus Saccharibacteria bacterium]|nr:MAG: hypothetical protein CYG49_00135 [Candidatus Saccharibacteria bacterium]